MYLLISIVAALVVGLVLVVLVQCVFDREQEPEQTTDQATVVQEDEA